MGTRRRVTELPEWVKARDQAVVARFTAPKRAEKPLTPNHLRYQAAIESKTIILAVGPAGTGKTTLACEVAVRLLKAGRIDQIVLTRPSVTCGSPIGYLPGDEAAKMAPYLAPLAKGLSRYLPPGEYDKLVAAGTIKIGSLELMRGETFERAVVICDEAENATYPQIRMILTRLGAESKIVLNGDITQTDITPGSQNPFARAVLKLRGHPEIALVKMTRADCLRPEIVQWVDEQLMADG